ncbi:hypothetical protein H6F95_01890 [Cyanobacteria bacterium FACHB-471]|nr:hypothetical protein [Cyanobacteria bacterium FACHB-471]
MISKSIQASLEPLMAIASNNETRPREACSTAPSCYPAHLLCVGCIGLNGRSQQKLL